MKIHYNNLPVTRNQRKMRRYILTDKDREKLLKWLDTDEEDQQTRNLLSQIRKNILKISDDIDLILKAIQKLQRQHRWWGRASRKDKFGQAYLRTRSKLKRVKAR